MKKPEAQTILLVLGLGAAFTGCTLLLGGDDYINLDATGSTSGEATTGAGGAATTASASSAGGMTTGHSASSTGTCGSGQGGCGGAGTSTTSSSSTATATSSASTGSGGPVSCQLSSGPFTDSFTGSPLNSAKWGVYADTLGSSITQTGNQVAIFNSGTANAFVGFYSQDRFPLEGCSVSLKVLDAPKITGLSVFFLLSSINDADQVGFTQNGNYLNMEVKLTSGLKASSQITFVEGKHVYWRFRDSFQTGKLSWETSADGAVWEEQYSYTTANLGFGVNQMRVNIGVTSNGSPGSTVHVDSFNLIP